MAMLASSGRFSRLVAGWSLLPGVIFIYPQLCRGNIIVCGVLFVVSAGTPKERPTAFVCWANPMAWRRQAVGGYEEAGRATTVVGSRDGRTGNR